jgi:hypothetical protein
MQQLFLGKLKVAVRQVRRLEPAILSRIDVHGELWVDCFAHPHTPAFYSTPQTGKTGRPRV